MAVDEFVQEEIVSESVYYAETAYVDPPPRIVFGETVWCSWCRGSGKVSVEGKKRKCARCAGHGLIPNQGAIVAIKKP